MTGLRWRKISLFRQAHQTKIDTGPPASPKPFCKADTADTYGVSGRLVGGVSKKGNSAKSCNFRAVIAFSGQRSFQLSGEGVRVNCFFGSKVISIVQRGVRVNCFSGQRSFQLSGEGCGWIAFQVKGQKVAGKCWIVCFGADRWMVVSVHCVLQVQAYKRSRFS